MDSIYASPIGAVGRIYLADRNGKTLVIEHGPEFKVLAENQLDDPIDATPTIVGDSIVGDSIFIRRSKNLYCIAKN